MKTDPRARAQRYEIRLHGHLDQRWAQRLDAIKLTLESSGQTVLHTGPIDQATLFGLMRQIRDLGLPLISLNPQE